MRKQRQKATPSRRRAANEIDLPIIAESIINDNVFTQGAFEMLNSQDQEKRPVDGGAALCFEDGREQAASPSNMEMERIEHRLVALLAASTAEIEDLKATYQRMQDKLENFVKENEQLQEDLHEEIQSRSREKRREVLEYVERKIHPLKEDLITRMEHNNATLKSSLIEDLKKQRNLMFLMSFVAVLISAGFYFLGQR